MLPVPEPPGTRLANGFAWEVNDRPTPESRRLRGDSMSREIAKRRIEEFFRVFAPSREAAYNLAFEGRELVRSASPFRSLRFANWPAVHQWE